MFRHQALITCKRQLKSLTQLSFSLMGESESGAKVDDEENGLTDHQYSRKLFLKTLPLRGLLSSLPYATLLHHPWVPPYWVNKLLFFFTPHSPSHWCLHRTPRPPWRKRERRANLAVLRFLVHDIEDQGHLLPGECRRCCWPKDSSQARSSSLSNSPTRPHGDVGSLSELILWIHPCLRI